MHSHPSTAHLEKQVLHISILTHVLHIYKKEVCHSLTLGGLCDMYIDTKGQAKVATNS